MLTKQEKAELNYEKLSPDLKRKIDAAFSSPYFTTTLALHVQKITLEEEMTETPFTIRGSTSNIEVSEDGLKNIIKESITSRQNTETAIKVAKWLCEIADDLNKLQDKLTIEEKAEAAIIFVGNAEDIKKKVREKHGIH